MSMDLGKPTIDEIDFILKKRVRLRFLHPRLFRKFNDIRGGCSEERERVLKAFSEWALNKYGMTHFECLMYYNYILCILDYDNPIFYPIADLMLKQGFIGSDTSNRFKDENDGIRWLVAYRLTKSIFHSKIEGN